MTAGRSGPIRGAVTEANSMAPKASEFLWGAASAAYQVEGSPKADGRGLGKWDVYTEAYRITEAVVGVQQTGDIAINAYDRKQYLADIALMRDLGINAYRFSISWPRILPEGIGAVNQAGLDWYGRFVDDLIENGITPIATLYHWDHPWALHVKGGWHSPESVGWFADYAAIVFRALGDRVKHFVTLNEPFIDTFMMDLAATRVRDRLGAPLRPTSAEYGRQAVALQHQYVAHAAAVAAYRAGGGKGMIGIALPLMPAHPLDPKRPEDVAAARLADGLINRWPLDAVLRGTLPGDAMDALRRANPAFAPDEAGLALLKANPSDFVGVNFYAPIFVGADDAYALGVRWNDTNPDAVKMFNGPVRPEAFYALLMRIRDEYGNPPVIVTENGAGFGDFDEVLEGGVVKDRLRTDYVRRHIAEMLQAKGDGADIRGYMTWSLFDNFEWIQGYTRRFGMVHVDYGTLKRTPKESFRAYRDIIARHS